MKRQYVVDYIADDVAHQAVFDAEDCCHALNQLVKHVAPRTLLADNYYVVIVRSTGEVIEVVWDGKRAKLRNPW